MVKKYLKNFKNFVYFYPSHPNSINVWHNQIWPAANFAGVLLAWDKAKHTPLNKAQNMG